MMIIFLKKKRNSLPICMKVLCRIIWGTHSWKTFSICLNRPIWKDSTHGSSKIMLVISLNSETNIQIYENQETNNGIYIQLNKSKIQSNDYQVKIRIKIQSNEIKVKSHGTNTTKDQDTKQ